jgi:hypothetical protein
MNIVHPSTLLIAGPSGSGKTSIVSEIISKNVIKPKPHSIIWYYSEWQPNLVNQLPRNVEFRQGVPELSEFDGTFPTLIVLDDLMSKTNGHIAELFTRGSHHRNITVFFLVQNIFHKNPHMRDININTSYVILFKNPRDKAQITNLARQMFPDEKQYLQSAYRQATSKPHGYLFLDFTQSTPDYDRIKTNIFQSPSPTYFLSQRHINRGVIPNLISVQNVSETEKKYPLAASAKKIKASKEEVNFERGRTRVVQNNL